MAVTAKHVGNIAGQINGVTREYAVVSGATVYEGEFVYLDGTTGRVTSASIPGVRLLGTVVGADNGNLDRAYSASATGNAGGTVKVLVNIDKDALYLLKNDNAVTTFAVTHVGTYFDLVGNPGSQLVDTSTTSTTGQLVCVGYAPLIRGTDTTYGLFKIAEAQIEL